MKLFIDTGFFIALTDKSDNYFKDARDCFVSQIEERAEMYSSNLVISETITWLRYRAGYKAAKEFGDKFRRSKILNVIWVDSYLEESAWHIFQKFTDKELSYVDCLSFACMKHNKIDHALTFDKHFKQVGFTALPSI